MVVTLIYDTYAIRLSRSSVSRLLNQLGLSAQRPLWRAYQQDPEKVQQWLNDQFPKIKALASAIKPTFSLAMKLGFARIIIAVQHGLNAAKPRWLPAQEPDLDSI